jgi:WD40 repeat protein
VTSESDVFICYSRRDRDFVERLHAALVGGGKEVYVDWEDIPDWSPDYEDDLFGGIDASDSFLFVLSPDSLASSHCKLELEHAVAKGKRIRPLDRRAADGAAVPEVLQKPQWIDFKGDERFEEAVANLLEALNVDADWARQHTRFALRASQWRDRGRDRSFLLRGSDLGDAERWLTGQAGKDPPPTEVQLEYVNASRGAAARRRRVTFGAVLIALTVAVALAVFAVLQRNEAIDQRDQAASVALVIAARDELESRPEVALLLGLEAYRSSATNDARTFMIDALERLRRSGAEPILHGHTDTVWTVAVSPDGNTVASGGDDATVRLWDLRDGKSIGGPLRLHSGRCASVAFSPDGDTLAVGSLDGTVRLFDVSTRKALGRPLRVPITGRVSSVAFSPDGDTLASAGAYGIRLWDVRTRKPAPQPAFGHERFVDSIAFSPDGRTLASAGRSGLRLWDVGTRKALRRARLGHDRFFSQVAFSPDGSMLASDESGGVIRLWDVDTRTALGRPLSGDSVAFSPKAPILAVGGGDGTIRLWNTRSQKQVGETFHGHTGFVSALAFSPGGRHLASAGDDWSVRVWSVPRRPFGQPLRGDAPAVTDVEFSPDGNTLATGGTGIRLWDSSSGTPSGQRFRGRYGHVHSVAFSPDGKLLASAGDDGTLRLWTVSTRTPDGPPLLAGPSTFYSRTHGLNGVAFSPDGKMLASGGDDGAVWLWELPSRKQARLPLSRDAGAVYSVAFSRDSRMLAVGSGDGLVRLWDVRAGKWLGTPLHGKTGSVHTVAFSPDGRVLASGGGYGIRLWNAATRKPIGDRLDALSAWRIAFSPDGRTLAEGRSERGVLELWDVSTRKQIGDPLSVVDTGSGPLALQLALHDGVDGVAFSPDGRMLVSARPRDRVRLWDGIFWKDFADLRGQVCRLVVGNLTKAEWTRYAAGLRYHTTCPG